MNWRCSMNSQQKCSIFSTWSMPAIACSGMRVGLWITSPYKHQVGREKPNVYLSTAVMILAVIACHIQSCVFFGECVWEGWIAQRICCKHRQDQEALHVQPSWAATSYWCNKQTISRVEISFKEIERVMTTCVKYTVCTCHLNRLFTYNI